MTTYKIDTTFPKILRVTRKICCTAAVISFMAAFGLVGNIDSGAVDITQGIPQIVTALGVCVIFTLLTALFARMEALEE